MSLLDWLACKVGIWALRRLFGECVTDVRDDFPDDPTLVCVSCDATRLIKIMQGLPHD